MEYRRNFEVHYCPAQSQNICVEVSSIQNGAAQRRCLYQEAQCHDCPYMVAESHPSVKSSQ